MAIAATSTYLPFDGACPSDVRDPPSPAAPTNMGTQSATPKVDYPVAPGEVLASLTPTVSAMSRSTTTSASLPSSSDARPAGEKSSVATTSSSHRRNLSSRTSSTSGVSSHKDPFRRPTVHNYPLPTQASRLLEPRASTVAYKPKFLWWDKLYLEICIAACWMAIFTSGIPIIGDFFRRLTLLSGKFDTNASLCMFLRYLYTYLPAPLNFDSKERYFARMFLEEQYHIFKSIIHYLGLRFLPPLLRPLYKSYYARAVGASDFVERCISERGVTQIVILGSGFDTNAYRSRATRIARKNNRLVRNVQVFELDLPRVQDYKLKLMRKNMGAADFQHYTEGVHFLPIDFSTQKVADVLVAGGFNPSEPTALLWEGVTYYLPMSAVEATLRDLQRLAGMQRQGLNIAEPGRPQPMWLFMDYMLQTETLLHGHTGKDRIWNLAIRQAQALGTSFITGFRDVVGELEAFDLHVINHVFCDDVATSLFADAPEEMRVLVEKNTTHGHNEPYLNLVECVFIQGGRRNDQNDDDSG